MLQRSELTAALVLRGLPVLIYLVAFLVGSIPFGLIVARIFHVRDLTKQGSGNIGATNVSRVVGFWPAGFITFALDVLKGALPVLIVGTAFFQGLVTNWCESMGLAACAAETSVSLAMVWATGFFGVLGHCYSPWLHFKGGKGVATAFGVILVLSPLSALFGLLAFVATFVEKRIGSLSSLTGLVVASVAYLIFNSVGAHLWFGAAMVVLIVVRHEANIHALLENREKTF